MKSGIIYDQIVGAVLAHYRKKAKLSQQEAAQGIDISASSISKLEKGNYSLTMDQLFQLSKKYGVSMQTITNSIEQTYENAVKSDITVETEKKSNTGLLLLGAAALAALVIASK